MRIKLDENLPVRLAAALRRLGHDVDTVPEEGLAGKPDADVWPASCAAGRFLVTQDLDFSDIRKFAPGTHPGLMLVRLRQPGARSLAQRIEAAFANQGPEAWVLCFTVLSDRKIRVRRPRTGA